MTLGIFLIVTCVVLFLVGVAIFAIEVSKQMKNSSNKQEKKYDFKWTPRMTTGAALMAPAVIALVYVCNRSAHRYVLCLKVCTKRSRAWVRPC